jgi:hypothetical protein
MHVMYVFTEKRSNRLSSINKSQDQDVLFYLQFDWGYNLQSTMFYLLAIAIALREMFFKVSQLLGTYMEFSGSKMCYE